MVEPAKNSIWIYLIPLWQLEQVSSTFGRRGVEVSLTSHYYKINPSAFFILEEAEGFCDTIKSFRRYRLRWRICMITLHDIAAAQKRR